MSLVLTLNEGGIPLRWTTWQEAICYKTRGCVSWEMGQEHWVKYGGLSRKTGKQSFVNYSSIIALRGSHAPKRRAPALTNPNLFGRDLRMCAYCGSEFEHKMLTNDHIVPRSRGGKHSWMNCVTSCKRCNNYKSDKLLEETDLKLLYVPYTPTREEALILKNRTILADQMEFLSTNLPVHSRVKMK